MNSTIVICGAGGIGRAAALILACNPTMNPEIYIGDISKEALRESKLWIEAGKSRQINIHTFVMPHKGSSTEVNAICKNADVILDCLPGSQAPRIARLALNQGCHYVNLTEHVAETNEIIDLSYDAHTGFLLQTGLAPGYVNVLACKLYQSFRQKYDSDHLEHMKMRVGALSENVTSPSFYAYTWSTIGVATEYVKKAIVVRDGIKKSIPSLQGKESIIINGQLLEDDFTSGGAANLPDAFDGKIKNLDYKTLRYPGHFDWVNALIKTLPENENLSLKLDEEMRKVIPFVEKDKVFIFAHVNGFDKKGVLRGLEKSYEILPSKVGSRTLKAIQATTASAMCEAAYMLLQGDMKGPILQSEVDFDVFLNGPYVSEVYGKYEEKEVEELLTT